NAVGRQSGDILAVEQDFPAGGPDHAGEAVEESRLAGAVGADDGTDLAAPDRDADVVQGGEAAEAHAQPLGAQDGNGAPAIGGEGAGSRRACGHAQANLQPVGGTSVFSLGMTSRIRYLPPWMSKRNSRRKAWWSSLRRSLSPCGKSSPSFISSPS